MNRYNPLNFQYGTWDWRFAEFLHTMELSIANRPEFRRLTWAQSEVAKRAQVEIALAEIANNA